MQTAKLGVALVACTAVFYLLFLFYFHLSHRFWSIQPVVHRYSLYALFRKRGCIKPLPLNNKYCSPLNIATLKYADATDAVRHDLCVMLSEHFDEEGKGRFEKDVFSPLMEGHDTDSFVSLYYKYSKIVGCLTGRPLKMRIGSEAIPLFYIDHLCVDKDMRKKGIAYALMQTHEHNQRMSNQEVHHSLFKRDAPISAVVPFVSSKTYGFKTGLFKPCTFDASVTFERVDSSGLHDLHEFLEAYQGNFNYCILPAFSHLAGLMETRNIWRCTS